MIEGDDVVHEIVVAAPRERVFGMFVDPQHLVRWIGISAELEPRPGGTFRFEVVPGQYCEGEYVAVEPPRRVVLSWGWTDPAMGVPPGSTEVEVTLDDEGPATRVRLVHRGLPDAAGPLHDDGWERFLERLTAVLGDRTVPAYPDEDPQLRAAQLRDRSSP